MFGTAAYQDLHEQAVALLHAQVSDVGQIAGRLRRL